MPYADSDSIEKYCFVKTKVATKAVEYAARAEARLREWISDAVYNDIESGSSSETLAKQAESLLALAFCLPQLNMRFSELGGLTKTIGIPGEESEQLMSMRELKMYAGKLEHSAFEIIESLVPDLDDPDEFTNGVFGMTATTNFTEEKKTPPTWLPSS